MTDLPPLAFLDCETTGLDLFDEVWDFAVILREPGKPDVEHQMFIDHNPAKAMHLPEPFLSDYFSRYGHEQAMTRRGLAVWMREHLAGVLMIGAVPSFDAARLEMLMRSTGSWVSETGAPWHYQLVDVETLTLGYLAGQNDAGADWRTIPMPPWNSRNLTSLVGVSDPTGIHTALGDARWARDTFDAVNPWPAYQRVSEPHRHDWVLVASHDTRPPVDWYTCGCGAEMERVRVP